MSESSPFFARGRDMSNRITSLRQAKGWSLTDLAHEVGTTKAQIQKLERGDRRLTLDWMVRLARALGVKVSTLLPEGEIECQHPPREQEVLRFIGEIPEAQQLPFLRLARHLFTFVTGVTGVSGGGLASLLPENSELNREMVSAWMNLSLDERKWALNMIQLAGERPSNGTAGP